MENQKFCAGCQQNLPLASFYSKGVGRIQSFCKKCLCQRQIERWVKRKIKAIQFLGGSCSRCGYARNYAALDFHHLDSQSKEFQWNRLRLRPWLQIETELRKCVLLCKNCHMEIHHPNAALDEN